MSLNIKKLIVLSFASWACVLLFINPAIGNTNPPLMASTVETIAAPKIEYKYLDGRPFTLADRLGKYTIINFWALWCAPCKAEMPELGNLQKALSKYDIEVIAINLGDPVKTIRRFLKKVDTGTLTIVLDPKSESHKSWRLQGLPTTFIIGPEGAITHVAQGVRAWGDEKNIQWLLGQLRLLP